MKYELAAIAVAVLLVVLQRIAGPKSERGQAIMGIIATALVIAALAFIVIGLLP